MLASELIRRLEIAIDEVGDKEVIDSEDEIIDAVYCSEDCEYIQLGI